MTAWSHPRPVHPGCNQRPLIGDGFTSTRTSKATVRRKADPSRAETLCTHEDRPTAQVAGADCVEPTRICIRCSAAVEFTEWQRGPSRSNGRGGGSAKRTYSRGLERSPMVIDTLCPAPTALLTGRSCGYDQGQLHRGLFMAMPLTSEEGSTEAVEGSTVIQTARNHRRCYSRISGYSA